MYEHQAVLTNELLQYAILDCSGTYLDATYGRGGHSEKILQQLDEQGKLFAFDKDPEACTHAKHRFGDDTRFQIVQGSYTNMNTLVRQGMNESFSGILFDLGLSSPQLEDPKRGFSFQHDGPLDMRMDSSTGISAAEWLASATVDEIRNVLLEHGEERNALKIAKAIKMSSHSIETTRQLAQLVASVSGMSSSRHPATRTFLAIRTYINNEKEDLSAGLTLALRLLKVGGRLAVISFHSLEDRVVKRFIRQMSTPHKAAKNLPLADDYSQVVLKKIGKLIRPSDDEVTVNPRARSARLRVAEKIRARQ